MLLKNQSRLDDIEVEAVTSPWYPQKDSMVDEYEADGIIYQRVIHPARKNSNSKFSHKLVKRFTNIGERKVSEERAKKSIFRSLFDFIYFGVFKIGRLCAKPLKIPWKIIEEKILMKYLEDSLVSRYKNGNIDIIHAHTPYRVALPALRAARKLSIPFVYEMRGMWEETAVANGRWRRNGLAYRRFKKMENKVLREADSVITICASLKEVAINRGVASSKIVIVTNGVEKEFIDDESKSQSFEKISQQLSSKQGRVVVGYIGSLREMEGVDYIAKAVGTLVKSGIDLKFFCLTGETGQSQLRKVCADEGIIDHSLVTGPIPHDEVPAIYDLIDIFVVSRPDYEVTRRVTPLKPFEAMGRGRAVVVSNLDALVEIVQDGVTGIVSEADNIESLATAVNHLVGNPELREELGSNARTWVEQNRLWKDIVLETSKSYKVALTSKK